MNGDQALTHVNMLACRLTSAALVYSAGDVAAPQVTGSLPGTAEEEQCRLYYYQFIMDSSSNEIKHQFALSAIPFEFPSIREDMSMSAAKFVYGCSTSQGSFGAALGRAVKIDCIVKIDAETLIKRGRKDPALTPITGCVDERTVEEILRSAIPGDTVQIFKLPEGHYAQESRFVPRHESKSEDDGYILTYVFDESQLDHEGECLPEAKSELWIIDAKDMKTIVGKVQLPMRVPYGLHGSYFSEQQVLNQRPVETIRGLTNLEKTQVQERTLWMSIRKSIEGVLA